jgi:urease accessory protein
MEALCYSGCLAENHLRLELAPGAEMIGWDITALGLPGADQPFDDGSFCQHIEMPGVWLERARIAASDKLLLNSPLGLAGQCCVSTLFFVSGSKLDRKRREAALEAARKVVESHPLNQYAGATSPDPQVVVLRVLSPIVEPAMGLLRQVWKTWRQHFWHQAAPSPRIWSV